MSETRKIAAILVSDVVGYSRLAGADEDRTLARLRALRSDLIDPTVALHDGRVVRRTAEGSRSKSHPMKALVLTALLLPPIGAAAVSPEDAYLAARDRYIASFKTTASAKDEKAAFARQDMAARDLELRLKAMVGPFSASGFPAEGKLNLVSLFPDDIGFGMLDGLVYGEGESAKSIVVTTDSLLDKWLLGRPKGRSIDDIPTSAAAAVKTENFYAQAVNSDSAAANYGEIPVAAPPGAKFAHAMLSLIGNGPLVPGTPDRIFVALEQGGRVFIVSEKLATPVPPIPACDAAGADATKRADAADGAFMKGGGKNRKLLDQVEKLRNEAADAVCACFAGKVKGTPAFTAAEAQAAAIVAALTGK
jgi:hypothetical protein